MRSAEVEDVLAQVQEAMSGTETVYRLFKDADLKFPAVRDSQGGEHELSHGRYMTYLESPDRQLRQGAFLTMHEEYGKWRNSLGASLAGAVKADVSRARVHHYESALHAALAPHDIPPEVYTNLIQSVREKMPVLHRYLRLRKKLLKVEQMEMWDLYAPMVTEVHRPVTYQEAGRLLLESSSPLGSRYGSVLQQGFEQRWVDVLENQGKTSGAFSDGAYTTPPYILMNWQDDLHQTLTLAHEFGHSVHSYWTRQSQPYVYANYSIFVAEVASTLNEALLIHHLVRQAQADGDVRLQMYLLNHYAEAFRTTLYRQTMFAEFELAIHQAIESGEALTASSMSEIYLELNRAYVGAEVEVHPTVAVEWARVPHFYFNFYVFQYATGISAAAALSKDILNGDIEARDRYLEFLKLGSSDTPINLLRTAGVDMTSPRPVHQALEVFENVIEQIEALSASCSTR